MSPSRTAARTRSLRSVQALLAGTGLLAALVAPDGLAAQRPTPAGVGGEVYFAHNTSFPIARYLAGAALTMGSGPIVLRGSGALNRVTGDVAGMAGATETPWTLDADLMLKPGALGQMAGIVLGG